MLAWYILFSVENSSHLLWYLKINRDNKCFFNCNLIDIEINMCPLCYVLTTAYRSDWFHMTSRLETPHTIKFPLSEEMSGIHLLLTHLRLLHCKSIWQCLLDKHTIVCFDIVICYIHHWAYSDNLFMVF